MKFKRRFQLIGFGIVLTSFVLVWANYDTNVEREKRLKEIEAVDISGWERNRIKK